MDLHKCTELYLLSSMTLMAKCVQYRKGKGKNKLQTYSVLMESVTCFTEQRPRACGTVITCWGPGKVSVWKILLALLTNYVDAELCYNLAELLGIVIKLSHPSFCSFSFFLLLFLSCTQAVMIPWAWYNSYNAVVCIVRTEHRDSPVISTAILQVHVRWLKFLIYLFLSLFGKDF